MTPESTRWTVIRRAAQGVPDDQAAFVRRYGPVIRSYLGARWRQTRLFDQVDDAAQQVFVECFQDDGALGRADESHGGSFGAFLHGVVRNVARNFERKRRRTKERQAEGEGDLEAIASKEASLGKLFDRAWATALIRDAAALQLERAHEAGPDAVRRHRLLALRYGENLPIREIAARWGVDAETLHRAYPKARDEFKRALLDVVRDLHEGGPEAVEAECARLIALFS